MNATDETHAAPSALESSTPAGIKTVLGWVAMSLVGFPVGGYVGYLVAGPVDAFVPALIGGALTGAGIGLAQWLMLRRTLHVGPVWLNFGA